MDRRAYLASVGGAVVGLGGCLGFLEDDYDVGMTPTDFDPRTVTVDVGSEVVWKNTSSRGHTVTAYEGSLPDGAEFFATGGFETESAAREAWNTGRDDDGILDVGETFSHTFEVPGRHEYLCIPHESENMVGTVVVEE